MTSGSESHFLSLIFFLAAGPFFLWLVFDALRTGVASVKYGQYDRANQPVLFWIAVGVLSVMAACCVFAVTRIALAK